MAPDRAFVARMEDFKQDKTIMGSIIQAEGGEDSAETSDVEGDDSVLTSGKNRGEVAGGVVGGVAREQVVENVSYIHAKIQNKTQHLTSQTKEA